MSRIYEPKGKAREYSPFALNYFNGCDHGCLYCYVPSLLGAFNSEYCHENVSCKDMSDIGKVAKSFSKSKNSNKQVLLSFTGDPYCAFESGQTRDVLCALMDNNIHIAVLTKNPEKALRDLDIIKGYEHIKIGGTLTCDNSKDSLEWESGAPYPESRIKGLREFAENGVKTWVSFEPVLFPEQTLNLIEKISPFIDHIKIGKLNNHPLEKTVDWRKFLYIAACKCRELKVRFYIKNDLAAYADNGASRVYLSTNERNQDYFDI